MPELQMIPAPQDECGEGCGRPAAIEVSGLTFCPTCLDEAVMLGRLLADTIDQATDQRRRIAAEAADG